MSQTWTLIADAATASIYEGSGLTKPLSKVKEFSNEKIREDRRDLVTDRPGRTFDRAGQGRHAKEPQHNVLEEETRRFANGIAEELRLARAQGEFDRLILVCDPSFLGLLRNEMDSKTRDAVVHSISKNWTDLSLSELNTKVGQEAKL